MAARQPPDGGRRRVDPPVAVAKIDAHIAGWRGIVTAAMRDGANKDGYAKLSNAPFERLTGG